MPRASFVREIQVRREILDRELEQVRELPHSLWRDMIGSPMSKTVVGRDNRAYVMRIEAKWDRPGAADVRVTLSLKPIGWRPTRALRERFVITADNRIVRSPQR